LKQINIQAKTGDPGSISTPLQIHKDDFTIEFAASSMSEQLTRLSMESFYGKPTLTISEVPFLQTSPEGRYANNRYLGEFSLAHDWKIT
jgi:hypothetical protein